ncbi:MAG: HAD-IA family hydrolase [Pirellulales bacterium]|nr:HAD-IA family hydrolase [Pirellulales bacterium]
MSDFSLPTTPLRAVVFDLDGLMFNTEDLYQQVGREVLSRRGKTLTGELLDEMMGRKPLVALQIMIDWHDLQDDPAGLAAESMEIMDQLLPAQLAPMPGLLALLNALEEAHLPKGIATSSSRPFVTRVLGQFELAPRFAFVLTSEDIVHGKPAPEIYQLAAEKFELTATDIMVLEDSQIGCRAALAAGNSVVAVPGGRSREHDFNGVQLVADSLADERIYAALGLRAR